MRAYLTDAGALATLSSCVTPGGGKKNVFEDAVYAVVQTGGKQYKAEVGKVLTVEKLETPTGDVVRFDRVLLISDGDTVTVGSPVIEGASVTGEVVDQGRGKKIIVFKYKPKVRYRRKTGHRQYQTQVLIQAISGANMAASGTNSEAGEAADGA
jgi:large subunit ribosomal protein L21